LRQPAACCARHYRCARAKASKLAHVNKLIVSRGSCDKIWDLFGETPEAMAGKIFINYRRDDSMGMAGRLHDRLAQTFGRDNLFMDVDHIPIGADFVAHLNSQVAECAVILVVIGPNWLGAKDEAGQRRLHQPDDFVAIEIAAALARGIRVIPVLIDGTRMPKASELPDSLKPLARRQAAEVRHAHFGQDAETLVARMREALGGGGSAGLRAWRRTAMAAAGAAVLLLVGWGGYAVLQNIQTIEHALQQREAELKAEQERQAKAAAEADAKRKAEEAEQQRLAAVKADEERKAKAAAEAEAQRRAAEAERQRLAAVKADEERKAKAAAPQPAKPAATAVAPAGDTQPTLLGQYGDWGAYAASLGGKSICFALAKPKTTKTEPAGRKRDPPYVFVSTRPAENVKNEVSIIVGYPFKTSSEATAEVGSAKFAMYTQNDKAWIKYLAEEARMVEAMRKGADLTVRGTSDGTTSTDQYSLKGLAQALDRIEQECK
jgi:hypothetical protein